MRIALWTVIATGLAACASQNDALTAATAKALLGRQLSTVVLDASLFENMGPDEPRPLGLVGAAIAAGREDRFRSENAIADPARQIADQLEGDLRRRYQLQSPPSSPPADSTDWLRATGNHPSEDLVLAVQTKRWGLIPFEILRTKSTRYRLVYTASIRLINARRDRALDGKGEAVLAQGSCNYNPDKTPTSPTYDQFLANKARRLLDELEVAKQFCMAEFRSKVLSPPGVR